MSFTERSVVAEMIAAVCVFTYFGATIFTNSLSGAYDGPDGLMLWARAVLWMIGTAIVVSIVIAIGVVMIYYFVTGEEVDDLKDERDHRIAGFGWQVNAIVISIGFVGAIALLAYGLRAPVALNTILVGFMAGDLLSGAAKLIRYQMGG